MFPGRRGAGRIFHNEVQAVGRRAAGLRAVRAERRRRRLHPGLLRRRDHARRQRLDVPRLAADGRDGDRREGHARGDGRRADAHRRLRLRPLARQDRRGGRSSSPRRYLVLLARQLASSSRRPAPPLAPGLADADRARSSPPTRTSRSTCSELIDALVDAGSLPRGPRALGQGADRRLRAPRRPRRSGSSPTSRRQKGGVLFVDSADKAARFIWTCNAFNVPLLFLADVPGFMIGTAGRAPGDHPPRREDDQRRLRGDRAEDLGGRPQGLRRRPLRDGRARPSSPTAASRCRAPRSP